MATYGWGTNEPIIAPEAEGGENIGTVCVKIKSAITDTFTKLNSETWADASTTASGYMSASDKIKLNGIATGAEVNQFAFSNISVGGTTISADTKQDTLTLVSGTGITLTPDAGNDKVTISFDSGANVNIAGNAASANSCPGIFTVGTATEGTGEGGEIILSRGASGPQVSIDNNRGTLRVFHSISGPPIIAELNLSDPGGWNCNAPKPRTSAGAGQIFSANPDRWTNVTVPSGGTWCVCKNDITNEGHFSFSNLLICSGGTVIAPSETRLCVTGIRIA